jgi:ABC-type Mn2+/Zn2+ transport system ATPase subunit
VTTIDPQPLLATRELVAGYDSTVVVDGVDLTLSPGDLLVLMGTNGSGKSTLIKTFAGLLAPIRGRVEVLGQPPGSLPERVAYLAQHPASSFTLPLRARDIVAMGRFAALGLMRRVGSRDRSAVAEAMERLGVDRFADRPLSELSGGQQQRTHLAQALARQADVLLIDEPTASLDAAGRVAVAEAIAGERRRGALVVMATHDLADAEQASTAMLLAHRVIAVGSPQDVLTDAHLRECYGFTERH